MSALGVSRLIPRSAMDGSLKGYQHITEDTFGRHHIRDEADRLDAAVKGANRRYTSVICLLSEF